MNGLQEAFYIYAIVFMSIILLIAIVLLITMLVIRNKVNRILNSIEAKVERVASIAERGGEIAALATGGILRKARRRILGKK